MHLTFTPIQTSGILTFFTPSLAFSRVTTVHLWAKA